MQKKLQSAMEYLMTYGWAILIIAVVLGALFQLGVFNPNTFAPKAHAGSCQVIRPYGSGNTNYISLAGACNNQLPQYVADIASGGNINFGTSSALQINGPVTLAIWVASPLSKYGSSCSPTPSLLFGQWITGSQYNHALFWADTCNQLAPEMISGSGAAGVAMANPNAYSDGVWHMVVGVRSSSTVYLYVDGALVSSHANAGTLQNLGDTWWVGGASAWPFNGKVSNAQLYNTSLSQNDITALYQEGIGGAPIDLFHLAGWWPLNGNANDYSGNADNGVESKVTYTSSWTNSYVTP